MPDRGTLGWDTNGERGDELERELIELGAHLDYPPTPDLASAVHQRLDEEPTRAAPRRPLPTWALAAAMLAVFLVVPAISFAVFGPFGGSGMSGGGQAAGGGGEVEDAAPERAQEDTMMEEAPSSGDSEEDVPSSAMGPDSASSAAGSAPSLGKGLGLGERISLEEAEVRMGGRLLPSGLGRPDEVYATEGPTGNGVAFVYGSRDDFARRAQNTGFVLTELPGGVDEAFGSGSGSGIEEVEVGGERGVWIPDPEASEGYRLTEELGGSTLFFTRGGVALRLETNLPKDEAIRLAESIE